MTTIPTNLPAESVLQPLRGLVASGEFTGEISAGDFSLRLRPGDRRAFPVAVKGQVVAAEGECAVLLVRTCVPWPAIVFLVVWPMALAVAVLGSGLRVAFPEVAGFSVLLLIGVIVSALSFRSESKRACEILRKVYAAPRKF